MHSIHLGSVCLFTGEPSGTSPDGKTQFSDLMYRVTITEDNVLASLFGEDDVEALKNAGTLPLKVFFGPSRDLEMVAQDDPDGGMIYVKDEMGSLVDFHDITLGALFLEPAFDEI